MLMIKWFKIENLIKKLLKNFESNNHIILILKC